MARPSKTRRVLKWGGTVTCVLLLALFVGSPWYFVEWSSSKRPAGLIMDSGRVAFGAVFGEGIGFSPTWPRLPARVTSAIPRPAPLTWIALYDAGWYVYRYPMERSEWIFIPWNPVPEWYQASGAGWHGFEVWVPLWIPLLVIALPTALLWWLDSRRYPPGYCQTCSYNLTGNVSGVCPECGTPVMQPSEGRT